MHYAQRPKPQICGLSSLSGVVSILPALMTVPPPNSNTFNMDSEAYA